MKKIMSIASVFVLALAIVGCSGEKKGDESTTDKTDTAEHTGVMHEDSHSGHDHDGHAGDHHGEAHSGHKGDSIHVDMEAGPQKLCPVMGEPIDKEVYVDYEGKRIYFCCTGCETEFMKDPAAYLEMMKDQGVKLEKAPEK